MIGRELDFGQSRGFVEGGRIIMLLQGVFSKLLISYVSYQIYIGMATIVN